MLDKILIQTHPEWHPILEQALAQMCPDYLGQLIITPDWLPGEHALFAAFRLPLSATRYILFGESPYPRVHSANGYAFWDAAVNQLWSEKGLSKEVNRATSLRNLLKMLLHARGDLTSDFSQAAIAAIDKKRLCQTGSELFQSFMCHGVLLLNACLVYRDGQVLFHAKYWRPFMQRLLLQLGKQNCDIQLLLFGKIAEAIPEAAQNFPVLIAEHPYNLSFIKNPKIIQFFEPLNILEKSYAL